MLMLRSQQLEQRLQLRQHLPLPLLLHLLLLPPLPLLLLPLLLNLLNLQAAAKSEITEMISLESIS